MPDLRDQAEIDVGGVELALLGEVVERRPEAMRSRAGRASSMFGNTICDTSRFSGVP